LLTFDSLFGKMDRLRCDSTQRVAGFSDAGYVSRTVSAYASNLLVHVVCFAVQLGHATTGQVLGLTRARPSFESYATFGIDDP
jgi:hypothetical protein